DLLEDRSESRNDFENLARKTGVKLVVSANDDELRTEPESLGRRHRRAHAEAAGLIGRRRDHAPSPPSTHPDALPPERRILKALCRDEKTVEVEVENHAHGSADVLSFPRMVGMDAKRVFLTATLGFALPLTAAAASVPTLPYSERTRPYSGWS